jgi:lipopolysaccharide cholinephosphotransferase
MKYNAEIRQVQLVELEILKEIIRICKENNIEYFLAGGTLLGAIRHRGFIPWDDDIDIIMVRDHYEKFLKIASKVLDKNYFLQTNKTDKNSPYQYAKIRKNNTKFEEWLIRGIKMHKGIFVDIFPYDNIPNNRTEQYKQFKKVQFYNKMILYKKTSSISEKPSNIKMMLKSIIRRMIFYFMHIIPSRFLENKLYEVMTMYNTQKTQLKACLLHPVFMGEFMSEDDLYPFQEADFENIKALVPKNYNRNLTNHYGEYMKLPPKDKQYGHRPYILEF